MVNNFSEFYYRRRPETAPDASTVIAQSVFDFDGYVNQSREPNRPFMQEFSKTQSFTNFVETAYSELYHDCNTSGGPPTAPRQKSDITYFQKCIKQLLRHSYKYVLHKQTAEIARLLDHFLKPVTLSFDDCYLQYEAALKAAAARPDVTLGSQPSTVPNVLDHTKIVRMDKFNPHVQLAEPPMIVSPKEVITQGMMPASQRGARHVKCNTINVQKAPGEKPAAKKCGQQRMCTNLGNLPVPTGMRSAAGSPKPPVRGQVKVFHERSPTNAMGRRPGMSTQQSPLNFLRNFLQSNSGSSSKENSVRARRKYHSPQSAGRKIESMDCSANCSNSGKKEIFLVQPVTQVPATCNGSPTVCNSRTSLESNKERSDSVVYASDNQLKITMSQLQKLSHPSDVSDRTTVDTTARPSTYTRGKSTISSVFEQCATPKLKDIKSRCYLQQQTVRPDRSKPSISIVRGETANMAALQKTVQPKSRNMHMGTNDSSTASVLFAKDPKCKQQLRYGSPVFGRLARGSASGLGFTITPSSRARLGTMLSEEISEENASPDAGKLSIQAKKPPLHGRDSRKENVRYQTTCTCPRSRAVGAPVITKTMERANKLLQYEETLLEIEEEQVAPPARHGPKLDSSTMSGCERGLSTRVLSHQGDDDDEPYLP